MVIRVGLGLLFGAAFALVGIWLAPRAEVAAISETSTTTTVAAQVADEPVWRAPTETVLGPTVLIPKSLELEEGEIVFSYDLADISPNALGRVRQPGETNVFFPEPAELPIVVPELWTLITADGEIAGTSATTSAKTARFPTDSAVLPEIRGIRIDQYRMRMPYVYTIPMEADSNRPILIDGGIEISVARVLRQSSSVIVQLDVELPDDYFIHGGLFPYPRIRGVGNQWRAGGPRDTGGVQMLWDGPDMPDIIDVEIRSVRWIPFDSSIEVDLGGLANG